MNYRIEVSGRFERQLKRLTKKFPSLKKEYAELISSLKQNPFQGTPLRNHCYKIRLAIASKGKGKSGGARIITHVQVIHSKIYMISVYDKSEQGDISDNELDALLKTIP